MSIEDESATLGRYLKFGLILLVIFLIAGVKSCNEMK
jgi:hypothetical protein